ncbi:MAG: 4-(cytidine 5'-diphospho)-2-C-methyl-D-erythritol kinase [Betaproteobacteria bacterium]
MSLQPQQVLREKAPAKLNLHLHVTGRRADGYHELDTSFVMIDWYDEVCVSRRSDGEVRRVADHAGIRFEADLSVRAALLLREQCLQLGLRCPGADLLVHKSIPLGAGLGGGSSNAASVLRLLNSLWELHWPPERLAELGARLGADVPVLVHRRHALARGIGEILKPLPLGSAHFVLVFPQVNIATAAVFDDPELTRTSEALKIPGWISWEWLLQSRNDLEKVASRRFGEVRAALCMLREAATSVGLPSHWPRMSGSGSTVFTMVRSASEGLQLRGGLEALCQRDGRSGWTVRGAASLP